MSGLFDTFGGILPWFLPALDLEDKIATIRIKVTWSVCTLSPNPKRAVSSISARKTKVGPHHILQL